MSRIPSHNERPRQYNNTTDHSHHETSFGGYTNQGTHVHVQEGTINFNQGHYAKANNPSKPLDKLRALSSPRAIFDSAERFDPPRCTEATRMKIIQRMDQWINEDGPHTIPASLFWLYGGAGVGKSALAQTLAERFDKQKQLAATFFSFKNDASSNDGNTLIPTLISQLVSTFEGLGPFVEQRIHANPDLFTKQHQTQIKEILVEPLIRLKSKKAPFFLSLVSRDMPGPRPRLIVIDGLDECHEPEAQCNLLRAIANALPQIPFPLRFLVTSRPEPHIVRVFKHDRTLQAITADRYNLSDDPDADMDIRIYLEKEFEEIRRLHCLARYLPAGWPEKDSITRLVERASGHFIYAATVIRYIRSEQHRPDDRLEVILRNLPPQERDHPYAQLDALYSLIFRGVENGDKLERIPLVLGILYVYNYSGMCSHRKLYSKCSTIEGILGMKAGDLILLLAPIFSLVTIKDEEVRILHKSLVDYLLDPIRCGDLLVPLDLARVHELTATYILEQKILANNCAMFEFVHFAYHCRYGHLNNTLKDYLCHLDVPYPKAINAGFESLLHIWLGNNSLEMIISHFFRALSRDDFDLTGQHHEQFAAKWMSYLQSAVPGCDKLQSKMPTKLDRHDVKDSLDKILEEWKPKDFRSPNASRMTSAEHLPGTIDREHRLWSTLARASATVTNSVAVSSLVFSDDFIHSYHFTAYERSMKQCHFLLLRTYSRHEKLSDGNSSLMEMDVFRAMQICLRKAEGFLCSEFSRKYGIFPEGLRDIGVQDI